MAELVTEWKWLAAMLLVAILINQFLSHVMPFWVGLPVWFLIGAIFGHLAHHLAHHQHD